MKKITTIKFTLLAVFAGLFLTFSHTAQAQTVDGFNPDANGFVRTVVVQTDGKIIIGGEFTQVAGTPRNRIARLNADGTLDTGFDPNASGLVYKIVLQADGKILVGGEFATIGGQTRNGLARLNADGTVDSFNPNPNSFGDPTYIFAIAVQTDGKILIGGFFYDVDAVSRFNLARVNADGTLDATFTAETDGQVFAIALQADGKILLGGYFATIGGQPRNRLARLNADGTLDTAFSADVDGGVLVIALQADGKILVGGQFSTIGGQPRTTLARLNIDGTVDSFNPGGDTGIFAIVVQPDGKILIGGDFATIIGGESRTNIARLNPDGTADSFDPNADTTVFAIAPQTDGKILIGGNFTTLNPNNTGAVTRNRVARLIPVAPTAASVAVAGRVTFGRNGRGVNRAVVSMTGADGIVRRATTNPFGYYRFADVAAGETYIFNVKSKSRGSEFAARVVTVNEDISDLNFTGN